MRPRLVTLLLALALLLGAVAPLTTRLVAQSVENLAEDPAVQREREIEQLEDALWTYVGQTRYADVVTTANRLLAIDPGNSKAVLYKDMAERKLAAGPSAPVQRRETPVATAAPVPTPAPAVTGSSLPPPPPVYVPKSGISTKVLLIALVALSIVLVVVVVVGFVMVRRARAAADAPAPINDARTVPNAMPAPRSALADMPTVPEPSASLPPPAPRVEAPAVMSVRPVDAPKPAAARAEGPRSQEAIALPSVNNSSEMQLGEFSTADGDDFNASDSQAPDIDRTKGDTFRKSPGAAPFAAPPSAAAGGLAMAPPPMPESSAPAASASVPSSAIFVPGAFSAPAPAPAAATPDPFAAPPPPAASAPSSPSGFAPKAFAPAPVPPSTGATMTKPLVDLPKPAAPPAPAPDPFAAPAPAPAAPAAAAPNDADAMTFNTLMFGGGAPPPVAPKPAPAPAPAAPPPAAAANEMTFNTMMFGGGAPAAAPDPFAALSAGAAPPDPFAAQAPKAPASAQEEATIGIALPGMSVGTDISDEKTIGLTSFAPLPEPPAPKPAAPPPPAKPSAKDDATLNIAAGSREVPKPGAAGVPASASGGSMFQRQYDAGKAAFDAGDFGKAVQCLSVAASLKPGDAAVRKLLEEARRQRKA